MKTLIFALILSAGAALPARAHHESNAFGLFWKAGAPSSHPTQELWRFAFISKYTWKGCDLARLQ